MTLSILCAAAVFVASARTNTAAAPVPRGPEFVPSDPEWMAKHEQFCARAKSGGIDLLFLGDSITDFWDDPDPQRGGLRVWNENFSGRAAVNFGIGADRTQHVLWRIRNGTLDGADPRAVVLMIGTNNTGYERDRPTVRRNAPEEVVEAIHLIIAEIRARIPRARILLFAILPRGAADDPVRAEIQAINAGLTALVRDSHVKFIDIGAQFLHVDGSIRRELMPDLLHPSEAGYRIWAEALSRELP